MFPRLLLRQEFIEVLKLGVVREVYCMQAIGGIVWFNHKDQQGLVGVARPMVFSHVIWGLNLLMLLT